MTIMIDSDLIVLMDHDDYIKSIVQAEQDKVHQLEENYNPVNLHISKYDLSIISLFTNDFKREVQIRLVI